MTLSYNFSNIMGIVCNKKYPFINVLNISMNVNKFYSFGINVSSKYNKKKYPIPQAIGLISSESSNPAWVNSLCSTFSLCFCVWALVWTVLLAAKLQSVWEEFLGWTPH